MNRVIAQDNPCLAAEATLTAKELQYQQLAFQSTLDSIKYQATISVLQSGGSVTTSRGASIATETPLADTPPGTILEVGQTWRQSGVSLTLTNARLNPVRSTFVGGATNVGLSFEFRNLTSSSIIFSFKATDFSVVDNLGNQFWYPQFRTPYGGCGGDGIPVTIPAGDGLNTEELCGRSASDPNVLYFDGDITNPAVTELTVTVAQFSRIQNARWSVPIPH